MRDEHPGPSLNSLNEQLALTFPTFLTIASSCAAVVHRTVPMIVLALKGKQTRQSSEGVGQLPLWRSLDSFSKHHDRQTKAHTYIRMAIVVFAHGIAPMILRRCRLNKRPDGTESACHK